MRKKMLGFIFAGWICSSRAWGGTGVYVDMTGRPDELHLKVNLEFTATDRIADLLMQLRQENCVTFSSQTGRESLGPLRAHADPDIRLVFHLVAVLIEGDLRKIDLLLGGIEKKPRGFLEEQLPLDQLRIRYSSRSPKA